MDLIIYPLLNLRSKRAITRIKKKWGHPYIYQPKYILISRLAEELSWSEDQVIKQIEEERAFLIQNLQYYK